MKTEEQIPPINHLINSRNNIPNTRRWVIKIGSALLTNDGAGLDFKAILNWVEQLADLSSQGIEIILVSSGAVAEGMQRLKWHERPKQLFELQAAAAVGQMGLIQTWESAFKKFDKHTAQILLTHDDLSNRKRYLNARSTICQLLKLGIIPIVNENDTVVTDEIRFGDNDTLAALVANLIEADLLVILTDQNGLYNADPRKNSEAKLISEATVSDKQLDQMAGDSKGVLGRGGMATKLRAARLAARSGTATIIASGRETKVLCSIHKGKDVGTLMLPGTDPLAARKQWLAGHLQMRGTLQLDDGAVNVLKNQGASLLPIGVTKVIGRFERGDMVVCVDKNQKEIARGLINYSVDEATKIIRQPSGEIINILGFCHAPELIHRDNLVIQ
ncbi:MAG: glutamate 5-kinase [Gammaproteobacteria bacterium]|nr:glutamate 5-kinase [Gammaproteobacteria bacterium]